MMPMPIDMDTTGAGPESTMGPGMAAQSKDMPLVLDADKRVKQRDEEWKQKRLGGPFQHPMVSMDSKDLDDTMEK